MAVSKKNGFVFYKIKGLDRVQRSIIKTFKDSAQSKAMLNKIGSSAQERILFYARQGKSLKGGKISNMPSLSPMTVSMRNWYKSKRPELIDKSFFIRPDFANVTLSGQLLNSLTFKSFKQKIVLFFKKTRKRLPTDKSRVNNQEVYSNLDSLGFGFLGLDKRGMDLIKKLVLDNYRRFIAKNFKK